MNHIMPVSWFVDNDNKLTFKGYNMKGEINTYVTTYKGDIKFKPYEWLAVKNVNVGNGGINIVRNSFKKEIGSNPPQTPEACAYWMSYKEEGEIKAIFMIILRGKGELSSYLITSLNVSNNIGDPELYLADNQRQIIDLFVNLCNGNEITRHLHYDEHDYLDTTITNVDMLLYLKRYQSGIPDISLLNVAKVVLNYEVDNINNNINNLISYVELLVCIDTTMRIYDDLRDTSNAYGMFINEILIYTDTEIITSIYPNIKLYDIDVLVEERKEEEYVIRFDYNPMVIGSYVGVNNSVVGPMSTLPNKIAMKILFSSATDQKVRKNFYDALDKIKQKIKILRLDLNYMYGYYKDGEEPDENIESYLIEKQIYEKYAPLRFAGEE